MLLKIFQNTNLTKGINEKKYRLISEQVTKNLPQVDDWLGRKILSILMECLIGIVL